MLKVPREFKARELVQGYAHLGSSDQVRIGDKVLLVHQANGETSRVVVLEAVVEGSTTYKELPAFKLHTLDGQPIVSGDSGGGVWLNGQLVGNMWGRETVQQAEA